MYTVDDNGSHPNFNYLITDFYSATDNHNKFLLWDFVNNKEDKSDAGHGINKKSSEYRFEKYMKEHGVDVDVQNNESKFLFIREKIQATADNYNSYAQNGDAQIIICLNPVVLLYNMDGTIRRNDKGGHGMTVTGVTDENMLIVSSWGEQLLVDPNDYVAGGATFQIVKYH
jgi:hypothetical protein